MSIGFIGLGNLGTAIAQRLTDMGEELKIYNRTKSKVEHLAYKIVDSPKKLIEECDIVFMCLFESSAVENILTMENGLLDADLEGKTIIDLTTNHFEEVLTFHNRIEDKGGDYLESPVFGSVHPVNQSQYSFLM